MSCERYPIETDTERETAIESAASALQGGDLALIPTDTVYGIAADAFDEEAVADLLKAKGRGRDMPAPVLVSAASTIDALAVDIPEYARVLVGAFWPGPLTLVLRQQTSLRWDLGDTRDTVAIRMPDLEITREILERTGPLAVSSANTTGAAAATDADRAIEMLGDAATVAVDAGPSPGGEASTIVDATGPRGRILRVGALSLARLDEALEPLGVTLLGEGEDDPGDDASAEGAESRD